jgi:hypothetical protein
MWGSSASNFFGKSIEIKLRFDRNVNKLLRTFVGFPFDANEWSIFFICHRFLSRFKKTIIGNVTAFLPPLCVLLLGPHDAHVIRQLSGHMG